MFVSFFLSWVIYVIVIIIIDSQAKIKINKKDKYISKGNKFIRIEKVSDLIYFCSLFICLSVFLGLLLRRYHVNKTVTNIIKNVKGIIPNNKNNLVNNARNIILQILMRRLPVEYILLLLTAY